MQRSSNVRPVIYILRKTPHQLFASGEVLRANQMICPEISDLSLVA
jgi:hypothetical protein